MLPFPHISRSVSQPLPDIGLHILVVEDNPGDSFLLEEQIRMTSLKIYQILQTQRLQQAQHQLQHLRFDLIFLDLSLPDSQGLESFVRLQAHAQHTPVIVLSGQSDAALALEAVRLGAQDYLVKGDFDEKLLTKVMLHSLERKRQLEQIEESEQKYKHLFEGNPQPMWVYHQHSERILAVNAAAVNHYGYSETAFLSMRMEQLFAPEERGRWEAWKGESSSVYSKDGTWQHLTHDGRQIQASILRHRLRFENQPACLVLAQDISAIVQAEQEKNLLIQELAYKNNHLEQFAYIVSHNLRAPVANLLGLCQISAEQPAEEIEQLIQMIQRSAQRLDDVIRQLNQTLNIQKGLHHQAFVPIELERLFADILSVYEPQLQEAGAICRLELQTGQCVGIYSYVYSIFENLISNAIKYRSPERPLEITLQSESQGQRIVISVSDNGLGLPERFLETYVFGMYKRFHSHVEGKGLGLFMCKNQVEALGGTIRVESRVGAGSRFVVSLPLVRPAAPGEESAI